jgi:peroxin-6
MRRGDIFAVPVWQDNPTSPEDDAEQEDDDEEDARGPEGSHADDDEESIHKVTTGIVYFKVTAINYEPMVPLEEDFRSSISSKTRAGELGCWIDVGQDGATQMVLEGVERDRLADRRLEKAWCRARKSSEIQPNSANQQRNPPCHSRGRIWCGSETFSSLVCLVATYHARCRCLF